MFWSGWMNSLLSSILLLTNVVVTAVKYDQDAADTDAVSQNVHEKVMNIMNIIENVFSKCIPLSVKLIISMNFYVMMIISFE